MKKALYIITFLSIVTCHLSIVPQSFAQEISPSPTPINVPEGNVPTRGIDFTLSPTFINIATDPGKGVNSQFKVRNNNSFAEYFEVSLVKIVGSNNGAPVIEDVKSDDEFVEWISYSPRQMILNPNEEKTVKFTFSPPESASLGYYFGFLIKRISRGDEKVDGGTAISGGAALSVLAEVRSPNAKREVQIVDFSTEQLFYEYLPTKFNIKVKNTGNVHVIPFGDIFIDSIIAKEIAIIPANEGRGNILPQTERTFTANWADGFAVRVPKEENGIVVRNKKGDIEYTTKYDFTKADKFRIGRYTANLILVYDNGERDIPIEATVSFWVIPWKIIGVALIVVIFVLVGVRSTLLGLIKKKG